MPDSLLINGRIHSPYFIFIQCGGAYSDADLLTRFGLRDYRRSDSSSNPGRYVCITSDRQWTHIADDWSYTLWHMASTRDVIDEIGSDHDVFACSAGDCDHSWDFIYYRHGRLLRKHVVEDPHFLGGRVVEEFGIPLEGEADAMKHSDELEIALGIASSLGIDVRHNMEKIRVYSPRS